jgi:ubiquinone/menaquinone biosynthesis C-methylase UbiE
MENKLKEIENIKRRYKMRENKSWRYNIIDPWMFKSEQEKERALIKWINTCSILPMEEKKILEIGCGSGGNLLQFLRLGFSPENLVGNELLQDRIIKARKKLPAGLNLIPGNALDLTIQESQFDIVFQSMVFSSILDEEFKFQLAKRMWGWVKEGGGVLWYDFIYNNPWNNDVKGITYKKLKEYFPEASIKKWKITLAPPLSRVVTKIHPSFYNIFNLFPFLRTHILCWIQKKDK